MVIEVADIEVKPGTQDAFDEAIARGLREVVSRAEGCLDWRVLRGVESAERYVLEITWSSVDAHEVAFRGGPLFTEWRAIVGPFFARPPRVEHFRVVVG